MTYSVVIPAFNAEDTLAECLDSVVGQTVPPVQVIVVDDGSSDRTVEVAKSFGKLVRCISQTNAGPGPATTRGLDLVRTEFAATLDADDVWLPVKAAEQIDVLSTQGEVDALFCHMRLFGETSNDPRIGQTYPGWSRSTMMTRTAIVPTVGPMIDPPGRRGELVDWLARARACGLRLEMSDRVLALRRIRPGSLSHGRDEAKDRGYLDVARRQILRRRNGPA